MHRLFASVYSVYSVYSVVSKPTLMGKSAIYKLDVLEKSTKQRATTMKKSILLAILLVSCTTAFAVQGESSAGFSPLSLALITPVQVPAPEYDCNGFRWDVIAGRQYATTGLTIGLVHITDDGTVGATLGLVNVDNGDFTGLELGICSFIRGDFIGAVESPILIVNGDLTGINDSFFANINGDVKGICASTIGITKSITGLQYGFVNISTEVCGLQFGLVNYTQGMRGFQIGLVNIITDSPLVVLPFANAFF